MNEMMNRIHLEGTWPHAALTSAWNERARTLKNDLNQSRSRRNNKRPCEQPYDTKPQEWAAEPHRLEGKPQPSAFDPTPFYLLAHPQQT